MRDNSRKKKKRRDNDWTALPYRSQVFVKRGTATQYIYVGGLRRGGACDYDSRRCCCC